MNRITLLLIAALAVFSNVNAKNDMKVYDDAQDPSTNVLGKLYFVNLKEGEKPVMAGLTLAGNRCGSEAFNAKPYATEGVRCVFELDEWVEFYPDTYAETGITVMVFQHKDDQQFYLKNKLDDETSGYCQTCELNKDPDAEEPASWGSFYLHPEEFKPGYYDLVFIYNNKVFATMLTRFYERKEISEKSDSELEKLMKQPVTQ